MWRAGVKLNQFLFAIPRFACRRSQGFYDLGNERPQILANLTLRRAEIRTSLSLNTEPRFMSSIDDSQTERVVGPKRAQQVSCANLIVRAIGDNG
jgi:hypothetical protein